MAAITVIVPVYRVEKYLRRCVDSILAQTFQNFTLVLVDDGSPDSCGEICEGYAAADPRIHALHRENGGLSAARNTGIDWAMARGDSGYLCFIDSDDWVRPEYLQALYSAAVEGNCRVSACGFARTAGEPLPEPTLSAPCILPPEDFYCGEFCGGLTATAWNKLYDASLFAEIRYPEGKLHEDEFTTYRLVYAAGAVAAVDGSLYAYYVNPEGITGTVWRPARMDALEAFQEQIAFARQGGYQKLWEKASLSLIYGAKDQLAQAGAQYRPRLRKYLRIGLREGRASGAFPWGQKTRWAYEIAYPCKPIWYLAGKIME